MITFIRWLKYRLVKWYLQEQHARTVNNLYYAYCHGELAMYEMRRHAVSEREFTLRRLASVEGYWAGVCRRIAHRLANAGKPEKCNEWTKKMVEAHCNRDNYLAQANQLKGK